MALLLLQNNKFYLKIDATGHYIIYKNKTARNKIKKATKSEKIIEKYNQIISSLYEKEYSYYNEIEVIDAERKKWISEYELYSYDFEHGITKNKYPLMAQYFPDVAKSIPEIVVEGNIGLPESVKTAEDAYNYIKYAGIFGPIDNLEDA